MCGLTASGMKSCSHGLDDSVGTPVLDHSVALVLLVKVLSSLWFFLVIRDPKDREGE